MAALQEPVVSTTRTINLKNWSSHHNKRDDYNETLMKKDDLKTGIYRHYKGGEYEVIGVATHSETAEKLVVYRTLYGNLDLWVRPFSMFVESVTIKEEEIPRFKFIGES